MKKVIGFLFLVLFFPSFSFADSYLEKRIFFVDKNYDLFGRQKVLATNLYLSQKAYFYVEEDFFSQLSGFEKQNFYEEIKKISREFDSKIYPELTSILGPEEKYGPNGDEKITILFHQMKEGMGGYFREEDNFEKAISPGSNERKIVYLNSDLVGKEILKSDLAHEFAHLIIFNQKRKILGVEEERWLQEMVAEISPTLLGYLENLNSRIQIFKKYPKDPILEWEEKEKDYGALSIFAHYLLDQFSPQFFSQILKTKKTGISAIEEVTKKKFEEIFRNWLIAVYFNDCTLKREYCFKLEPLENLKILPELHFLPISGGSILTLFRQTKDFSGDWQKFYGGKGDLTLSFLGEAQAEFDVSFALCPKKNKCQIFLLGLEKGKEGSFLIPDFDLNYNSLILFIFSKTEKVPKENPPSFNFVLKITSKEKSSQEETSLPSSPQKKREFSCKSIKNFLKYGMRGEEIKCLQEVLKSEGGEIYPEGLITGYFGPLTLKAVKKFQLKYSKEILAPWGLTYPTGFVGPTTREKLNQILGSA